jgi:Domain of unknown function (DUF5615)
VKLALDHHYSPRIAQSLRERGHDAVAAIEAGWEAEDDEPLLVLCADDQRALLTNNVADCAVIGRRWNTEGRAHHGLIFSSDASLPRTRDNIGRYVDLMDALMRDNSGAADFIDRTHWL